MGADRPDVRPRLEAYYTRYYRDMLGISGWRDFVDVRLADQVHESQRLARVERALGYPVTGRRVLNVGCGTGGFNVAAERAGAETWDVDPSADAWPLRRPAFRGGVSSAPAPRRSRFRTSALTWSCFETHYKLVWVPGLPRWMTRVYLAARGRPTSFLETLRLVTLAECRQIVESAGARIAGMLDADAERPVGGPLWPLVRLYYRLCGIHPYLELVVIRRRDA